MEGITLNKIVYDILNLVYGGNTSDDADISERQVAFWINQVRALLIRQELSNKLDIHDSYIQQFTVELDRVDTAEDCEVETGCYLLRSISKIPTTIRRGGKNTIISIQSLDEKQSFSETSFFRKRFNAYNKYTGSKSRWYLKNDYLYLTNTKVIERIKISGVFENPEDLAEFTTCEGNSCFSWDDKYPISADMVLAISDIILKSKFNIIASNPKDDNTNDAKDEAKK